MERLQGGHRLRVQPPTKINGMPAASQGRAATEYQLGRLPASEESVHFDACKSIESRSLP
jgi:hypothetical protein